MVACLCFYPVFDVSFVAVVAGSPDALSVCVFVGWFVGCVLCCCCWLCALSGVVGRQSRIIECLCLCEGMAAVCVYCLPGPYTVVLILSCWQGPLHRGYCLFPLSFLCYVLWARAGLSLPLCSDGLHACIGDPSRAFGRFYGGYIKLTIKKKKKKKKRQGQD